MQPPAQIPLSVWELLEQLYLDSANSRDSDSYAGLTDDEKRAILKDFAKEQAAKSPRWAAIVEDLRVVSLQLGDTADKVPCSVQSAK
jgi:hypothetical protein